MWADVQNNALVINAPPKKMRELNQIIDKLEVLFPDVDFPIVTVTVPFEGADPETVESEVTDTIEEAVWFGQQLVEQDVDVGMLELAARAEIAQKDVRRAVHHALRPRLGLRSPFVGSLTAEDCPGHPADEPADDQGNEDQQ